MPLPRWNASLGIEPEAGALVTDVDCEHVSHEPDRDGHRALTVYVGVLHENVKDLVEDRRRDRGDSRLEAP